MPKAGKPAISRHRVPVQARSKATVNAILVATAQVLVEHGYAGASTNKIARRAGVGIGTFYEYFSGKDAVIRALLDAMVQETLDRLQKPMPALMAEPYPVASRKWLRMVVELLQEHAALVRVIVEQVPRWGEIETVRNIERRMTEFTRVVALQNGDKYRNDNLDAALFLIAGMIRAAVLRIVLERPGHLTVDQLVDELVNIVAGYYQYGRQG